jgi:hypothetical protein
MSVVEHVRYMTHDHPDAQPGASGMSIMNVGFGLGIVRSADSVADYLGRPTVSYTSNGGTPCSTTSHYH